MPPKTTMPSQTKEQFDAFSYYSSDFNRMRKLLLVEADEIIPRGLLRLPDNLNNGANIGDGTGNAPKRRRGKYSHSIQDNARKTRLTFEVHPSLMFADDLFSDTEDAATISDDEESEADEPTKSSKKNASSQDE